MTDNTQAELRKEIDVIVGNPLNRVRDTDAIVELVTAYTNKQIEAVLDRLESRAAYGPSGTSPLINPREIEAERNKLMEAEL